MAELSFIAVNVGNSRVQIGTFEDGSLRSMERFELADRASIIDRILTESRSLGDTTHPVVFASVNDVFARQLDQAIHDQLGANVYFIGTDLPIPIGTQLDPETITGVDRLLNAAAAYATLKQACIVVDAGTAVTVDFVDGHGTFQGGAIAPGAQMQLKSLHASTALLPEVSFAEPSESFGRSTSQAMLQGVYFGIRGLVWKLVERYAQAYGGYPTVIATGGDAVRLFADDDLVDRVVPDLTLLGIAETVRTALRSDIDKDQSSSNAPPHDAP